MPVMFVGPCSPDACAVAKNFKLQNTSGFLCVFSFTSRALFAGKELRLLSSYACKLSVSVFFLAR